MTEIHLVQCQTKLLHFQSHQCQYQKGYRRLCALFHPEIIILIMMDNVLFTVTPNTVTDLKLTLFSHHSVITG